MNRSYEYTAHLSKENTSNLWSFLVKRLDLDLNDFISGEEFEAFIAFFSELIDDDETLGAFAEINADWNVGKFTSFAKYIPLNFHFIVGPWPLSTLQPGKYNLFSRAEFELKSRKADSNYIKDFFQLQKKLQEMGGFETIFKEEQKKKQEQKLEAKRKIDALLSKTERGIRVNWSKNDHEIAELIGNKVSCSHITAAKKEHTLRWLADCKFRTPTDEQLEFIIDTHHSIRVTARAGSGKTETVATKILFLLHFIGLSPDHILALVFNVEARNDIIKRIEDLEEQAGLISKGPYSVMNFDRLAYGVVRPKANILDEKGFSQTIKELVNFFLSAECEHSELIKQFMLISFEADWDKWLSNNERYTLDQLDKLRSLLMEQAIDSTLVKSKGEKRIADFFFEHNIDYHYEYPWRTDHGVVIYPDFYLPQYKLMIEYWGMHGDKDYDESSEFKRSYWDTKPGYKLVEIFPSHLSGLSPNFLEGREEDYAAIAGLIKQALIEQGCGDIELCKLSDEELLAKLKKRISMEVEKLFSTSLARLGQRCRSNADVISLVNSYKTSDEAERQFINLLPIIDQTYRDLLSANHATDYAKLKWDCIDLIEQGISSFAVEKGTIQVYPARLRYIFIDEFQDFSEVYQKIIQALLYHANDAVVNAVGDDWQMINRFAGSDLSLFHGFSDAFPRTKNLTLTTNFRSSPQVVEFCNALMEGQGAQANVADHLKEVKGRVTQVSLSNLQLTDAEEHYFKADPVISSLLRLIPACMSQLGLNEKFDIAQATNQGEESLKPFFYVLTHTNYPKGLKVGADHFSFMKNESGRSLSFLHKFLAKIYNKELFPTAISALTAHRSKGKEAEVVFLLAPEQFPLIHPSSVFLGIFGDDLNTIINDERRLFYVACSRARKWLFLLTFAPAKQPDYLPKHLLELFNWDEAPYVRKIPDGLYRIEITNQKGDFKALFDNMERLKVFWGFNFTKDNGVPIRWQKLECTLPEVTRYITQLIEEFKDAKLQWVLFDAAGDSIFQWPGPIDPKAFLNATLQIEANTQSAPPPAIAIPIIDERQHVNSLCLSVYEYFLDPKHMLQKFKPQTGFELIKSGHVIAQAELAWPKHKSAVVITEDDYINFTDQGWRAWLPTIDDNDNNQSNNMEILELATLLSHLRRAERINSLSI
jgi:DNA helicase IV